MRSFVVFTALFAVGMCGVLPGGYNYNSGSTFNHNAVVGPALASNVQQVAYQQPSGSYASPTTYSQPAVATISGGSTSFISSGQPALTTGSGGFVSGPSGSFGSATVAQPAVSTVSGGFPVSGGFVSGPSGNFGSATIPQPAVSTFSGGFPSATVGAPAFEQSGFVEEAPRHEAPIITKQFYLHSAPEDHDSVGKSKHFVLGRAQKNYRVVFIKAPSSSNANVHLSAEYAPQEEKTVIYVLSQKEHELDVNDIATPAPTQPSKPEVFFIKYKTPEEAAHAQQEIQSQYNVLGGQDHFSDEGTAPVSDVSGALGPQNQGSQSHGQQNVGYLPPAASQNYLPPSH